MKFLCLGEEDSISKNQVLY